MRLILPVLLALSATPLLIGAKAPRAATPFLSYSTYLGGTHGAWGTAIAAEPDGTIVEAYADGVQEPMEGVPPQGASSDGSTVLRFNPHTNHLLFSVKVPGVVTGLAALPHGRIAAAGYTRSPSFPSLNPIFDGPGGDLDAFLTEFDGQGHVLTASAFGGKGPDLAEGIAADAQGDIAIVGTTVSSDFPVSHPAYSHLGGGTCSVFTGSGFGQTACPDAFALRLDPQRHVVFSTYLGGSARDEGHAVALDASGATYITGRTESINFPATYGLQTRNVGSADAFAVKLDASGQPTWGTYLGGRDDDEGNGIAVDRVGAVYVVGSTRSSAFPVKSAIQRYNRTDEEGWDVFLTKLRANGRSLAYSTYLGGYNHDFGAAVAVDTHGRAYITGTMSSTDFPAVHALQKSMAQGRCAMQTGPRQSTGGDACTDAFVSEVSSDGKRLIYSTPLTGHGIDSGTGLTLGRAQTVWITGSTTSRDFPTRHPRQPTNHGRPVITNLPQQTFRPNVFVTAIGVH